MSIVFPEDVMKAAKVACDAVGIQTMATPSAPSAAGLASMIAITAEREAADERAAKIVTEWEKTMLPGQFIHQAFENVASAIRDRSKT